MKKRISTLILALALACSLLVFPAGAAEIVDSGTCGKNVSWTLDKNGLLIISGTGIMADYSTVENRPWNEQISFITEVVIEPGVTSIGKSAFENCSSITSVTIPESVTTIEYSAFRNCSSMTNVTIPNSVTSIKYATFADCSSLTNITIPDSVTSIGEMAFYCCEKLTSITIPDSVSSIGDEAFAICGSLTSVAIPDSVTSIGVGAFFGCESLTSITIPESVTSIQNSAFRRCSSLTSITIPDSVTSIGVGAFYFCESLKSITIPNSVTSIGDGAFEGCSLTSVTIPDSVTSIGARAFRDCESLTSVTISGSVTSIGEGAFDSCSLTSVTIPDSVTSIGDGVFAECYSLQSIKVSNGNTKYCSLNGVLFTKDQKALLTYPCGKSGSYAIPDGVTSIVARAFEGCQNLTSVTIPSSVTSIGKTAFGGCLSLTSVTIPDGVTSIEDGVFGYCLRLTSVTIPDSVTSIGSAVFRGCSSLTSVTIPDSVTSIGDEAFYSCDRLTSVTISDGIISIGNSAFSGCSYLKSVTIPDSVTSIGNDAFRGCSSLTEVAIPDGISSIGGGTFSGCYRLTSVYIPDSVTDIGGFAFYACGSLTDIYYGGDFSQWAAVSIGGYNESLTSATIHYGAATHALIVADPVDVTIPINGTATFTVATSGTDFTYQWQYKTPTGTWKNCTAKTEGYNTDTLTVEATANRSGYQYRCIVTDGSGNTVTSNAATLTVQKVLNITTQPKDASVVGTNTTTFKVVAAGDGLTYQWQYNNHATGVWRNNSSATKGYNTDTLTVEATAARNGYQYRCVVTDANGNTVTSDPATLTVFAIKTQPKNASVVGTSSANFKVSATGSDLTYQWQYKNPATGVWKNCSSATKGYNTATLTVTGVSGKTNRNGYQYRCVVKDAVGNKLTTKAVTLNVFAIKTQPKNASTSGSAKASFKMAATGTDLTYQWQYKNPANGVWKNCSAATEGYNTATLKVAGVTGKTNRNGYQYRCVVTDGAGNKLTTNAVTLTVK